MLNSLLAISLGASAGAILRWLLGISLNTIFPDIPPGTVLANLLGSYLIGIAIVVLANNPTIAPEWRLFVITGFLGGLTTFSTFSAEVMNLLQHGRVALAFGAIGIHLIGSLLMTLLGMLTVSFFKTT
ncbi:fluoride efflux transporter CrcB [Nitrosomonas oligotropha]|uniref:Fluoride-specific ion channel FluC n=1 Tax=Nitrosomonas oligotropha TaxID=42354 RepID=A0A1H8UFB8_9PROT|nr:fluoride efflux transporter CrcB [Nitrosomonas oligotropha]PTQ76267.1 camphor resistance protein CrcB [Nitrosomonas oligotropha]SDX44626.1 camphor resistance protein CrcB [Nitrosomonas oligotropha]SEP01776.1 camphor resistance protein CrcB [Nitrosomonas oligotropha]